MRELENGCSNSGGDDGGEVGLCGNDTLFWRADVLNVLTDGGRFLFTILFFFKHFTKY